MRVVIIGAGPTGLGAAWQLQASGTEWELYESESQAGGLSASFMADGFTWDIGGHILFSHYPEFIEILQKVMGMDAWLKHPRRSFIRYRERWVPYPFQNNLRYLPDAERAACLKDLDQVDVQGRLNPKAWPDFQSLLVGTMGAALARLFMVPYNTKVWGYPPDRMSTDWIGERVAVPDVARIRRMIEEQRDDAGWGPNAVFHFPRHGGTGAIWKAVTRALPAERLHWNSPVVAIDAEHHVFRLFDGRQVKYDVLISTMPLTRLVTVAGLTDLQQYAARLLHTSTHVIGMGFRGMPAAAAADKSWLYFGEAEYPFYRVTVFSNYSANNAPDGHHSFMAEVSESAARPVDPAKLAERCVDGLRRAGLVPADAMPVHVWQKRIEFSYPVPGLERDSMLAELNPVLERREIYSRGRFGAWKYEVGNMDHSFMQGVEIGRRILTGEPEKTVTTPDVVNRTVVPW